LDATHFRQRAAHAREMAQSGDDIRLLRMLLEVASELDAEAEAMEAGGPMGRRGFQRVRVQSDYRGRLHQTGPDPDTMPVKIIDLSAGGASFNSERAQTPGSRVILELPEHAIRLDGSIVRVRGWEVAMVFEPASSANPALGRLLQSAIEMDLIRA
jgi:hypothetical protein